MCCVLWGMCGACVRVREACVWGRAACVSLSLSVFMGCVGESLGVCFHVLYDVCVVL